MVNKEKLESIVEKLKRYRKEYYSISPVELGKYLRLKSNLMQQGIYITDEMLELPTEQVIELIKRQIENIVSSEQTLEKDFEILDKITDEERLDMELLENERMAIRNTILSQDMTAKITRSGKTFQLSTSVNMRTIKVNVPSTWKIEIPQVLLLEIYDEQIGTVPRLNLDSLLNFVVFMFERYQDYGAVRAVIEMELAYNKNVKMEEVNEEIYHKCLSMGVDHVGSVIVAILVDAIGIGKVGIEDVRKWIGGDKIKTRRRLMRVLEIFTGGEEELKGEVKIEDSSGDKWEAFCAESI